MNSFHLDLIENEKLVQIIINYTQIAKHILIVF